MAIRFGKRDGNSGIDYKESLLKTVEYCEKTDIQGAPDVKGVPKGRLISKEQADKLRIFIRDYKP